MSSRATAMPPERGPSRTFRRYLCFEAPGWAVAAALLWLGVESFGVPTWLAGLLLAVWIGKDFALYPLLRHAYEDQDPDPSASLRGRIGEVRSRLDPSGYVLLGSELWHAQTEARHRPVESGARVRVREVRGLTLWVEPVPGSPTPSEEAGDRAW